MWLLKYIVNDTTYQKTYETLTDVLKFIHKTQNAYQYNITYLEPNN